MPTYTVRVPVVPPAPTGPESPVAHPDGTVDWEAPLAGTPGPAGTLTVSTPPSAVDRATLLSRLSLQSNRTANTMLRDSFQRSNRQLFADQAPTGHVYRTQGSSTVPVITSGRYVPSSPPGTPEIVYADLDDTVTSVWMKWVYSAVGTTAGENVVIGVCQQVFAPASIQWQIYANRTTVGYDWQLQAVYVSGTQQYVTLAQGNFDNSFTRTYDSKTEYYAEMVRLPGSNTVVLFCPDGSNVVVTDSRIATYWGYAVGLQLRRPSGSGSGTDGYAQFTEWGVGGSAKPALRQPVPGAYSYFPALATDYASAPSPNVSITDLDVRMIVKMDSTATSQDLVSWYNSNSRGFCLSVNSSGQLFLRTSPDGTGANVTGTASSVAATGITAGLVAVGVSRVGSTGAINYYTATDLTAVDAATGFADAKWSLLGIARSSTAGGVFNAAAALQVGTSQVNNALAGGVQYLAVRSGINGTVVSGFDQRGPFNGEGLNGERWSFAGKNWRWVLPESSVSGLPADLASIRSSITALGAGLYKHHQASPVLGTAVASGGSTANDILYLPTSIPAASLAVGQLYKFRAMYSVSTGGTSGAFTDHWQSGPAGSLVDMDASSLCASQTSAGVLYGWIDLDMLIMATGSSGKILTRGFIYRPNVAAGTGALIAIPVTNTTGPVTLDLSTAFNPQMKVTTPVPTSGTNQFTLIDAALDQIH